MEYVQQQCVLHDAFGLPSTHHLSRQFCQQEMAGTDLMLPWSATGRDGTICSTIIPHDAFPANRDTPESQGRHTRVWFANILSGITVGRPVPCLRGSETYTMSAAGAHPQTRKPMHTADGSGSALIAVTLRPGSHNKSAYDQNHTWVGIPCIPTCT